MKRIQVLFLSLFFSFLAGFSTLGWAEDVEIYLRTAQAITQETRPNILFMLDNSSSMNEPIRKETGAWVKPTEYRIDLLKRAIELMLTGGEQDNEETKEVEHIEGVNNVNVGIGRFAVSKIKTDFLVNAPIMFPVSFVDEKLQEIAGEEDNNIIDVSAMVADSSDDAEQNLGTGETNLTNPQLQMTQAVIQEPSSGIKTEVAIEKKDDTAIEWLDNGQLETKRDNLILGTDPNRTDTLVGLRFANLGIPKGANIDYATIVLTSDDNYENQKVNLTIAIADNDGVPKPKKEQDASSVSFGNDDFKNPKGNTDGYLSGKDYPEDQKNFPLLKNQPEEEPVLVNWTLPANLEEGQLIKTPPINSLIQGIVNREGWSDNNSIVLLIQRKPDSVVDDSSPDDSSPDDNNVPPGDYIGVYALDKPPVLRVYWTLNETNFSQVAKEQAKESNGTFDTTEIRLGNEKQQQGTTLVGIRFDKVAVPPGAKISEAKITFTRQSEQTSEDEAGNQEPLNLKIYAEDIGNAKPFNKEQLLSRSQRPTDKSVEWNDVATVAVGEVLTTPNLNEILQQIIDNPDNDWKAENSVVFLFEKNGDVNGFRRVVANGDKKGNGGNIKPNEDTLPKLEITFSADVEQKEVDPQTLKQMVGLRFTNVEIPQGAEVISARLTFTSGSSTADPAKLIIQAEDVDDAQPFAEEENNLSNRETTTEKVIWDMEGGWVDDKPYTSPDLKKLVQAVVNRQNWCGGRSGIAFIITAEDEDNPLRIARSFDYGPDDAPVLTIQFDMKKIDGTGCVDQSHMGQIMSSGDNAEERLEPTSEKGNISTTSNTLELGKYQDSDTSPLYSQLVGLRFQQIPIPQGAIVKEASLSFYAREDGNAASTVEIAGQKSADTKAFSKTDLISDEHGRPRTDSKVEWELTPWEKNKSYRNNNIGPIVQEIVNQEKWEAYNSMVFIISGSGRRGAYSFKDPALAPILKIKIEGNLESGLTVRRQLQRISNKMEIPKKLSFTAITDALYEAVQYFRGDEVDLGKTRHNYSDYLVSHPGTYTNGELITPEGCIVNLDPLDPKCAGETIQGSAKYTSPVKSDCQVNHVVLLTDGLATKNTAADKIAELTGIGTKQDCQSNYPDPDPDGTGKKVNVSENEKCALDLAKYVSTHNIFDQQELTQKDQEIGDNTLTIHTIGFQLGSGWTDTYYVTENGNKREVEWDRDDRKYYYKGSKTEVDNNLLRTLVRRTEEDKKQTKENEEAKKFLKQLAAEGKGHFYEAVNALNLVKAFKAIIQEALTKSTSFAAPGISVSQFNNLLHDKEVYYALFKPSHNQLWEGNVKKYTIEDGKLKDEPGNDASAGNKFSDQAQSYWSSEPDGDEVTKGGAGERLNKLGSANRKIYTYLEDTKPGSNHNIDLSQYQIQVESGNDGFDQALRSALKITDDNPEEIAKKTIRWIIGENINAQVSDDVNDPAGGNNQPTGNHVVDRWMVADPLHASPKAVTYGGTYTERTTKLFVATNDGLLHMLDANSGDEEWAFLPRELLPKQSEMMKNESGDRIYGLDSTPTFWYKDNDGNQQIDGTEDFLRIYIGMRRGGRNFYALDVTNTQQPKLMWTIKGGEGDFEKLGQTWSSAFPVEVDPRFCDNNKSPCIVLVFGGGYDPSQDGTDNTNCDTVTMGNAIFMVDAETGKRLWWASDKGSNLKDFQVDLDEMKCPIAADLFPVDSDGDHWVDRLYAADTGGQIWRIELKFDANDDDASIGGLRARISSQEPAEHSEQRRFFYPPIWAKVGQYELLVAVTGTRPDPLKQIIADKFYVFNDPSFPLDPNGKLSKLITWKPLSENDSINMNNVTNQIMNNQSNNGNQDCMENGGWYFDLSLPGEKGLSMPQVVGNTALFTTYVPDDQTNTNECKGPSQGSSWLYAFDLSKSCGGTTDLFSDKVEDNDKTNNRGNFAIDAGSGMVQMSISVQAEGVYELPSGGQDPIKVKNHKFQRTFWMQQE